MVIKINIIILFYSYSMYYPTGGVFDFVFSFVIIVTIVVVVILLHRFEKNKDYSKYHDKEYLRTLELPELHFLIPGADTIEDIK